MKAEKHWNRSDNKALLLFNLLAPLIAPLALFQQFLIIYDQLSFWNHTEGPVSCIVTWVLSRPKSKPRLEIRIKNGRKYCRTDVSMTAPPTTFSIFSTIIIKMAQTLCNYCWVLSEALLRIWAFSILKKTQLARIIWSKSTTLPMLGGVVSSIAPSH